MRIALIFPPYTHKIFSENLSTVDEEFCIAPPIILAYVAAILEKHGHKVLLLDARVLNLTKEEALGKLRNFNPDILGFRAETYHFHDALEWVRYLKLKLDIPVIAGGINLTFYPKEALSHKEIDYGIVGEAIESLPKFIAALENGDGFRHIPGIAYKEDGNIIINPPANSLVDFDTYPYPARHLLPNEKYHSFISQRKNFTIMLTSTGCPFQCTFCAIPTGYRARSPENVINEIEACYRDFNIREIDFFDAVLFLSKSRILEICSLIKERKLDIEWSARSRVDIVDREILKEASSAGCRQIYYGIESVEQDVLNRINKRIEPRRAKEVIRLSKNFGIRTMGFFMVGNPGETSESVHKTIAFAKGMGLDFIQVCRTLAKPGTELDNLMIKNTGRDYWREHVKGNKIAGRLPTPWSTLTEHQIESLTKKFYLKFYLRPHILFNRIFQLRSTEELKRYIKVGWKMLLQKSEAYSHILTDVSEAEELLVKSDNYRLRARELKVAVIIPTYNERGNIEKIISSVLGVLPQARIVVVDDKSTDGTGLIVEELSRQDNRIYAVHREGRRGLGLAYKEGFNFVLNNLDADYICQMDADLSHNPRYLPILLYYTYKGYDVVTGSRFLRKVTIKNRALWRNIISKSTKWFVNIFTGMGLTDVTTGYKCFSRKLVKKIDFGRIISEGYAFQIEISHIARELGADIKEIPILFVERSVGDSKMSSNIMLEGITLVFRLTYRRLKKIFKNSWQRT